MILHIPHSGTNILDRNISQHDINRGTDWFTDQLFSHTNTDRVVQEHSRFIVDCERLPDDIEALFHEGYGVCYTKDFDGNDIIVPDTKEAMLKIYDDHHAKLNFETRKILPYIPVVFIVDCHSWGDEQIVSDIDFNFGYNSDFSNFEMLEKIKNLLEKKGYKIGINNPYGNAIVPSQFYGNELVKSIMIEVNKRLYLTDKFEKSDNFEKTKNIITEVLEIISTEEGSYDLI
ncbi:MAG: N-formylglutamate amidohydrolase [Saccharospirillaceae bacterium]|nr:N-formylglutamate amidohydrolase [Saccharospirillaceae bacterium]